MKLVFYSGGNEQDNISLDLASIELTGKRRPKITYIPSCSMEGEYDFQDFVRHVTSLGPERFLYCPVDIPQDKTILKEAFKSDIIHLGGGNTYYFLYHLRKSNLLASLKKFVEKGGVLTGLSAGGIIMTPDILTASFPSFDRDENEENIKNLKALNLVKFQFFPHYKKSKRYDDELIRESLKTKHPLYALPDGSGIIIDGQSFKVQGKCWCFYAGEKHALY